ncbi:MAG: 2-oxo-4-hydroxy-4-carboxy-5-ureidoimidazoline decarboxylase [Bauldia sp.]
MSIAIAPIGVEDVNRLAADAFIARFGDVAEASPWVAAAAARSRPYADREAMIRAFQSAIATASAERQLGVLRAHPDLAGRATLAGEILPDSRTEQASAGLDRLTAEEFARFTTLNARYRERFGFPFILAVRGATKTLILAAFERRLENAPADELAAAVGEVQRIVRFRLEGRIAG